MMNLIRIEIQKYELSKNMEAPLIESAMEIFIEARSDGLCEEGAMEITREFIRKKIGEIRKM